MTRTSSFCAISQLGKFWVKMHQKTGKKSPPEVQNYLKVILSRPTGGDAALKTECAPYWSPRSRLFGSVQPTYAGQKFESTESLYQRGGPCGNLKDAAAQSIYLGGVAYRIP